MSNDRITRLRTWLVPTVTGPFITLWGLVTLGAVVGEAAQRFLPALLDERLDGWALGMLLAGFFASGLVVTLIVADVVLLRLGVCALPTGARAWLSSLLAPFAVALVSRFWPGAGDSIPLIVLSIAGPMLGGAVLSRLALGSK